MGDEFDGCECVWNHELAMRRLLSLLRQGQSYCTDTECTDMPDLLNQSRNPESGNFMFMSIFIIFAVILYMLRPNLMRRNINDIQKPRQEPPSSNGGPPPTVG